MGAENIARGYGILLAVIFTSLIAHAQFEVVEPEPFRGDEVGDRSFSFNEQSFIDRFSYRFLPEFSRQWELHPEGYRSTIGSVSNDELYSVIQFRKRWLLDENVFTSVRYRQDEDFDSDYERLLVGSGISWNEHWSVGVLADITKQKKDIDLHFEFEWQQSPLALASDQADKKQSGHRARLVFVLPDHFYNGKSTYGHYRRKPQTFFGELVFALPRASVLQFWFNYNPKLELNLYEPSLMYSYKRLSGGMRIDVGASDALRLLARLRYETGSEDQRALDSDSLLQELRRRNLIMETQFDYQFIPNLSGWIGARYFGFEERDERPGVQSPPFSTDRAEVMGHLGLIWYVGGRFRLAPGAYFNRVNVQDSPLAGSSVDKDLITGKFSFPLIYDFEGYEGKLIVQPNLEFPGDIFGGLNVQVQWRL